ncbi:MAG: OsmC family protein [Bacteroidales bacterium]|nr:OsmC family protein [Bacteroidales bacterium]
MHIKFNGKSKISAEYKGFSIKTDQSERGGGEGSAPAPFDLFLASIGTCAGYYIKSFCDQRDIDIDGIEITQKMIYNQMEGRISGIDIEVKLPADFPEKYKNALISAANSCAVKKHILTPPEFKISTI